MTAQRKESYFPELEGEEQRVADEWLDDYLRLVLRIRRGLLDLLRMPPMSAGDPTWSREQVASSLQPQQHVVVYRPDVLLLGYFQQTRI